MLLRCVHAAVCAGVGVATIAVSATGHAQIAAPSQLTPQSLRPAAPPNAPRVVLPGSSDITAPNGNSDLTVLVADVQLEGQFPELFALTEPVIGSLRNRTVSVAQIYSAAAELERIYAAAGYVLVRIVVPPQNLVDHGRLSLVVVDGFIEAVDVAALPEKVRVAVAGRVGGLVGRRHLRLTEIERALLVAGEIPGLSLRSTLARGEREGGVRLILDGEHRLVSVSAGADDRLPGSLGTWQLRGTVALNSAFGAGEQIYGTAGIGPDRNAAIGGSSPLAIYGAGAIIPIGVDGLTLNPEYTRSTTRTAQAPGVPASTGVFERYALRLREPISLTRKASLFFNFSLEDIDQRMIAPDFGTSLNHDHYAVLRTGPDLTSTLSWGAGLQVGALLSQGLGGRGAIDAAASGIPLSRLGAGPDFTKLGGTAHIGQPLPAGFRIDLIAAAQTSFNKPMLRPEQIVLDGSDALSAFASGTFSADQGVTLRSELSRPFVLNAASATLSPYLFGAVGRGWLANATRVEQASFYAGSAGLGVRGNVEEAANRPGGSLALEVARGFTDLAGVRQGWRANVIASVVY